MIDKAQLLGLHLVTMSVACNMQLESANFDQDTADVLIDGDQPCSIWTMKGNIIDGKVDSPYVLDKISKAETKEYHSGLGQPFQVYLDTKILKNAHSRNFYTRDTKDFGRCEFIRIDYTAHDEHATIRKCEAINTVQLVSAMSDSAQITIYTNEDSGPDGSIDSYGSGYPNDSSDIDFWDYNVKQYWSTSRFLEDEYSFAQWTNYQTLTMPNNVSTDEHDQVPIDVCHFQVSSQFLTGQEETVDDLNGGYWTYTESVVGIEQCSITARSTIVEEFIAAGYECAK